jgi:hypothetical protein
VHGLGRLAAWCYDHRRRVLGVWVLAVIIVTGLAQAVGSRLSNALSSAGRAALFAGATVVIAGRHGVARLRQLVAATAARPPVAAHRHRTTQRASPAGLARRTGETGREGVPDRAPANLQ